MTTLRMRLAVCAVVLAAISTASHAADVTIAFQSSPPWADPQFSFVPSTKPLRYAVFEALTDQDNNGVVQPKLAKSFARLDDTTWEFKLRENVVFSDGTPFTSDDVIFSYHRIRTMKQAPVPMSGYLRTVKEVKAIDPLTIRIVTHAPAPMLPDDVSNLSITSRKIGEGKETADYIDPKVAIGTGPYKMVSFTLNDHIVLERNDRYWGEKEPWNRVIMRIMENDAARQAALLSNTLDVIELLPFNEIERYRKDSKFSVWSNFTGRHAFYALPLGGAAAKSGTVTDLDDKPLAQNPFDDPRVREAVKIAVNLKAFNDRVYHGGIVSTGQYMSEQQPAKIPGIQPWTADEARAKKLMEEAGWAGKLKITLVAANSNMPETQKVYEALAQTWSRISIKVDVKILPTPVYLARRTAGEIGILSMVYSSSGSAPEGPMVAMLHSMDQAKGYGLFNLGGYKNPAVDAALEKAMVTHDPAARQALMTDAMKAALADNAIVPLWNFAVSHASRKGIKILPRWGGEIRVQNVKPE